MQLLSLFSLAASLASVAVAEAEVSPRPGIQYDETADWYKNHGKPVPDVATEITTIEANKSYVVRLECQDCPYLVRDGKDYAPLKRDNALLLKFDVEDAASALSTMSLNGAQVLPLAAMPLFIYAYQVNANISQDVMDSIVRERMLDPDFSAQTRYNRFPVQYEHTLLKTKTPGQWWLQFDVTGMQWGQDRESIFDKDRRIVQMLVKEQKRENGEGNSLSIKDINIVERHMREQPIKMKCGKLALVKTSFNPKEWDQYGKLGSWSHMWNMVFGKIGQYWMDHIQHNALLLPLALLLAFVIFFARVWSQRRQQEKAMDAEYALLETTDIDLPPAYSDIPIIKIEEYD